MTVVAAMAGCGGDDNESASTAATDTGAEIENTQRAETTSQSAPRPKPSKPDPAAADNMFFLATDDDAVALEEVISRYQDVELGRAAEQAAIGHVGSRIDTRNRKRAASTGKRSAGAAALAAAAIRALEATSPRQLVLARVAAQDARQQLTAEFIGPGK
jgi:hypothetical protein